MPNPSIALAIKIHSCYCAVLLETDVQELIVENGVDQLDFRVDESDAAHRDRRRRAKTTLERERGESGRKGIISKYRDREYNKRTYG